MFFATHQHGPAMGIHVFPHPKHLLPHPSPPVFLWLSQSTDFECPASCIKLALVICLHMVMYMFQCCSLKSSHPCLLPLSSKICVLHLCLLYCPACRIIITIFLKSISSVQFSSSVVSNSATPWITHARPPCPSPTPGVHSNSCPSSRWCHPAISSSVVPFSSCPQSLPASEYFPMSQLFTWGGQSIGVSALASVLPKNTQDWSPLEWTSWISLHIYVLIYSICLSLSDYFTLYKGL